MPEFLGAPMVSRGTFEVRDGIVGRYVEAEMWECEKTGTLRLDESACVSDDDYITGHYRDLIGEAPDVATFYELHDKEQPWHLIFLPFQRGKVVADVGCAAGSLLDFLKGLSRHTIAVEPSTQYHASLFAKGHDVFQWPTQAPAGVADYVYSLNTIEHVSDPVALLRDCARILKPEGILALCTPSYGPSMLDVRDDWLRDFLRRQHRWYFTTAGLREMASEAGLHAIHGHARGSSVDPRSAYVYASFTHAGV